MILKRYTIVKNIAGRTRKFHLKKQDSSTNMPVKLIIYLLEFNYTNDRNKNKKRIKYTQKCKKEISE